MSREKQIEEMAKDICKFGCVCTCLECEYVKLADDDCACIDVKIAEGLYNAGYRKASDVAEEIFAEIEKIIADLEYRANTPRKTVKVEELKAQCDWILHEVVPKALAELKKKYIGKDTNVTTNTEEGK